MYEPLVFLEQMDNTLILPGEEEAVQKLANQKHQQWVKALGKDTLLSEYFSVQRDLSLSVCNTAKLNNKYSNRIYSWMNDLRMQPPNLEDFYNLLAFTQIRNEWSENKIAYKIDKSFVKVLSSMKLPKEFAIDCVTKLPVDCFYIDFDGEELFCKDCCGCFVEKCEANGVLYLLFVTLIKDKSTGRVMPVRTHLQMALGENSENDKCKLDLNPELIITLELENGKVCQFNEELFINFIINFMIYLQAANKEVALSAATKSVYKERKAGVQPKNTFKEVKQYEVGFRYGKTIRAGKKVSHNKETLSDKKTSGGKDDGFKREISTHYRSAHWHSYWVGSGDNKERIIKWVEGVLVKGSKETNDVVLHRVTAF